MNTDNIPVISPNFNESDIKTLKDYFEFNKRYYDAINEELRHDLEHHPVFGPMMAMQTPEQQKAQNERSLELQRAAIFEDKWEAYSKDLIMQGITYARMNISYEDWYYVIKIYKDRLIPLIKKDFPELEKVISFIDGLSKFVDFAMYGIAEAYFAEKNNIIKAKEEQFRAIFENSSDNILLIDKNSIILMVNRVSIRFTKEEVIGKSLLDLQLPDTKETVVNAINTVLKTKTSFVFESEYISDGKKVYFSTSISPIFNDKKEVENMVFISRDVTAQKRGEMEIKEMNVILERKVDERTEELMKTNAELEQFAYVASHDLQEPLRTISNFAGLFQKRYKGKLDKDADDYLESIVGSTGRMQVLIKDLLDYSRIGKSDLEKTNVDCNLVLQEVLDDINKSTDESNAEIHATTLPVIKGYPSEMKSLFQNLISNAVKFQKKDTRPVINIAAKDNGSEWIFSVQDNGIGIEKIYFGKLFKLFQRLHNKHEYPGTGIGLVQCQKVIALHGGKIWVESEPGAGSTFYFTIPKNNQAL